MNSVTHSLTHFRGEDRAWSIDQTALETLHQKMQALKVGYIFPDFSKEVRETMRENHQHAPIVDGEKAKALVTL